LNVPKDTDRRKWILLPDGENQTGWLEKSGAKMYGCFRTQWRLPEGTERTWRERVDLGQQSLGVRAAERLLIDKIREFFAAKLTAAGLPRKGTPDTTFAWLLEKVKETRSPDWKANTARINKMYLKTLRDKLGHIPIRDFATVEMQDYLRGWQVATLIRHLREHGQRRDALVVTMFYSCALRPGEPAWTRRRPLGREAASTSQKPSDRNSISGKNGVAM
jgi:hypothetical protein